MGYSRCLAGPLRAVEGSTRALAVYAVACVVLLTGCEALDQLAVGRTDRLGAAPFYVTYDNVPTARGPVLALPVSLDRIAEGKIVSPEHEAALRPLLDALNRSLAENGCCVYVYPGEGALPAGAPSIYVGSLEGEDAPEGTGIERMPHEEYPPMMLYIDRPDEEWRGAIAELAAAERADRLLVIYLGFSQYPKADRGVFGKKVVLGSNYEEPIRFLSAVDKPVEVVHLTGALVGPDGVVIRTGAEGIAAYDAPFMLQVVDAGPLRRILAFKAADID